MCYIMTANGFTLLTSEERDRLYGISSKDNKNKKKNRRPVTPIPSFKAYDMTYNPADKIEPKFHEGEWITIKE